ncbi:ABC-2 type transport system permease protein [Paenibacillus sp. 1_12]|uniref:ABC transporter permease n=1 Tax=Paenibacillus sp. 1_12 TaxID=1566278 RepID=UPI0008E4132A|nr:ABC-2 family transporter protein [Paenibacillus sp. 1_12]SFK73887.1 ABC-2 type transport system permease protein [Paenibacillus sp. 1_12]
MVKQTAGLAAFVWSCWKLNLAGAMEFRISFMLTAGMMVVNNIVWILFWGLYFQRFQVVNGWSLQDVMMMWAVSAGGFGLSAVLFGNAYRLASLISSGQLDVFLSQPKPVLLHILISRMSVSAIGDVLFALIVYGVFGDTTLMGIFKFALALLITLLIFIFFVVIVQSLAFFIGNAEGIGQQVFNGLLAFSTYPTGIFSGWGKLILFTIIPAGFISYLPIGLLRSMEPLFVWQAIGVAVGLAIAGTAFFYYGLKKYSSGNSMGMRM